MKTNAINRKGDRGYLQLDLIAGLAILGIGILPLAFSLAHEQRMLRIEYIRAAATEVVDGETEILAAGGWKNLPDGTQAYSVHSKTSAHLPGHFQLTKTGNHLRLEWLPDKPMGVGKITREINLQ